MSTWCHRFSSLSGDPQLFPHCSLLQLLGPKALKGHGFSLCLFVFLRPSFSVLLRPSFSVLLRPSFKKNYYTVRSFDTKFGMHHPILLKRSYFEKNLWNIFYLNSYRQKSTSKARAPGMNTWLRYVGEERPIPIGGSMMQYIKWPGSDEWERQGLFPLVVLWCQNLHQRNVHLAWTPGSDVWERQGQPTAWW